MMVKDVLRELDKQSKAKVYSLIQEKNAGVPLIEYNSTLIPEEILRACGANTYFMCRGGEPEPTEAVLDYMLRFMNPLARSMAGYLELGLDPVTPHSDLLVTAQTDCHVGRITELLETKGVKVNKVGIPADWKKSIAFEYYVESLGKMVAMAEEVTGKKCDMEAAKHNFEVSNRINETFRKINELRKGDSPILFEDYIRLQHLSFSLGDPEAFADKLDEIYEELQASEGVFPEGAPRLLVVGRVIAIGDYVLPRLIDKCGGAVVAELLDECIRITETDVKTDGDLIENFARSRYLDKMPLTIFQPAWRERFEYVKKAIEEYDIDGVIFYQLEFDEIYDMEYTCLQKWLSEMNVPMLKLETAYSYSREEMGPLTTRVESFVESLKEVK
jgi:benzoyl-CoA reductase/2-hydroxyglutaryl-CoA dehydratase subunit BcrC/BadD/HgdB